MQHWHPANSLFDFLLLSKRRTIKWALWFHTSIKTDTTTNTNCLRRQWQDANNTLEVKKAFHWVPDVLSTKHEFSTRGIHPTSFHITPQVIEIISETAVKMGTTCPQLFSASLHLWAELNVIIILSFSGVFSCYDEANPVNKTTSHSNNVSTFIWLPHAFANPLLCTVPFLCWCYIWNMRPGFRSDKEIK